jgi:hypothetical protein
MPNTTPRLGLKKPLGTEVVDITVLNDNADTLDLNVAKKADLDAHTANTSNPHSVTTTQIGAETPTGAQAKVDTHAADAVKHITSAERTTWNGKLDGSTYNGQVNQDVRTSASPTFSTVNAQVTLDISGGEKHVSFVNGSIVTYLYGRPSDNVVGMYSVSAGVESPVFSYNPSTKTFSIDAANITINGGGIMKPRTTKVTKYTQAGYTNLVTTTIASSSGVAGKISKIYVKSSNAVTTNQTFRLTIDGVVIAQSTSGVNIQGGQELITQLDTSGNIIFNFSGIGTAEPLDMQFKNSFSVDAVAFGTDASNTIYYDVIWESE